MMGKLSYASFSKKQLELRDYLALERTILSNERTLLSYLQNGLAFTVTGITALYAGTIILLDIIGIVFILIGVIVTAAGVIRFKRVKNRLDEASPAESAEEAAVLMSTNQTET